LHLERCTGAGSNKDTVDYRRDEHDDVVNAAAGAVTLTGIGKRNPLLTHPMSYAAAPCRWPPCMGPVRTQTG
jgi:hypothetical protein